MELCYEQNMTAGAQLTSHPPQSDEALESGKVQLGDLPHELHQLVLQYLAAKSILAAHSVCTAWRRLVEESQLRGSMLWAALRSTGRFAADCEGSSRKWAGDWSMEMQEPGSNAVVTCTFALMCHEHDASLNDRPRCGMLRGRIGLDGQLALDRSGCVGHLLEQGSARRNRKKIDFLDTDGNVAFTWHKVGPDVCRQCHALRPHARRDWLDSRILLCLDCWDARNTRAVQQQAGQTRDGGGGTLALSFDVDLH